MAVARGARPQPRRPVSAERGRPTTDASETARSRLVRTLTWSTAAVIAAVVVLLAAPLPTLVRIIGLVAVALAVATGLRTLVATVNRRQAAASKEHAAYVAWLDAQDELPAIDAMTGQQFEDKVVALFHRDGVRDVRRVGGAGDRGVDIRGTLPDGRSTIVQCKRWRKDITDPELMKFVGTVHLYNPDVAVYVTAGRYTQPARRTGREQRIVCLDRDQLAYWLHGTPIQNLIAMHDEHNARHRAP